MKIKNQTQVKWFNSIRVLHCPLQEAVRKLNHSHSDTCYRKSGIAEVNMIYLEFKEIMQQFPVFSVREIEKHFPEFDNRRLVEW
jgi:hypothetical protein